MAIVVTDVRGAVYTRLGNISCEIKIGEQWFPFTASENDPENHGRQLFTDLISGRYGEIKPYEEPPEALTQSRERKKVEINAWRNAMEAANYTFEHNGRKWDYGKSTQTRLEPSVAAAKAGKLPEAFFWTDAENNDVPMKSEELIALSEAAEQAMFTKGLEIHVRQRTMKKEIEALGDAEAILAYKVGMADR